MRQCLSSGQFIYSRKTSGELEKRRLASPGALAVTAHACRECIVTQDETGETNTWTWTHAWTSMETMECTLYAIARWTSIHARQITGDRGVFLHGIYFVHWPWWGSEIFAVKDAAWREKVQHTIILKGI